MGAPSYDLLMASIPHRYDRLCLLLAEFDRQMRPGVGLRIHYDNLVVPVGEKYGILARSSQADYVSVFEDDDWPAPDFIDRILKALESRPDYVGFPVKWTHDGIPQIPIEHSLRYNDWHNYPHMLVRDINQFNPMRRQLALLGTYAAKDPDRDVAWDYYWTTGVRASGLCKTEAWIPEPMHYYRTLSHDTFLTPRVPMAGEDIPPVPKYPWLTEVSG